MSSILSSPAVVLATAMAVSGTVIFLSLRREKNFPSTLFPVGNQNSHPTKQILRPCLSTGGKKREGKKKRVQFADGVKEDQTGNNSEEYRKKSTISRSRKSCRGEIHEMPANRVALYSGILRDRVQCLEYSY